MERRGHHVAFWFHDALAPGLTHSGLRRLLVPWLIAIKVIWATVAGERFDIVEINAMSGAPYGLISRVLRPRLPACVVLSHGLDERGWRAHVAYLRGRGLEPPLRSRVLIPLTLLSQARLALRTADAVLLVSSEDARYLKDRIGIPADRVSLPLSGVSEELFGVERKAFSEMRVLFLGGWIERKGTRELVAAWRRLAPEREWVRLTLAGVGDADRARADVAGLERVQVIPVIERPKLSGLLARHDVFVLPSWYEGMSLAMLEAAAAGLACVVSGVSGSLDVFRPEDPRRDGAILTPAGDADALHRSLIELADDADLRATLGARARERARRFTWASNADRTLVAYSAALERRHTAAARR
jgi:glycosyltransferase involved in cell wall biosynthesis